MKKILVALFIGLISLNSYAGVIVMAEDLAKDAQDARENSQPFVLFLTAKDCPYCERLRNEYFQFSTEDKRFILREIEIGVYHKTSDFDGKESTHQKLADRYNLSLTPTVAFVGPDGEVLAKPIVGILTMDFYHYYFEKALEESIAALR